MPYWGSVFSTRLDGMDKHTGAPSVYKQRTRPCPGIEFLSSPHFPADLQGNLLVGNVIGFQGILQYTLKPGANPAADAYREAIEWMYSNPEALKMYATKMKVPEELIAKALSQSHPRSAMQLERLSEMDSVMADAVANKFLEEPMTQQQLMEFYPFPDLGK